MKRNDVILRLALKDKRNIPADSFDHQKIGGTNLQESREKSDFDIIDNLSETGKIDFDIPQCNLARANQDFIANFDLPNDLQTQSEKYDLTISNSATYNTEVIPSTSSIEVKDQSSKQIEKPIDDSSTDSSSDTESTCSSDSSSSTSNEDSDDSVKDPDFQIKERRSIKISDDSETEDNVGNQATPAATSSVSTLYSNLDDTIPDTKKRSRKRVAKPTEWLQNKCKILRNAGSAYVTLKTKVKKDARKIKPPCSERCRLKCKEKFSEVDREAVFKEFWELKDINRQRDFINRHMAPIKRKYRYTTTQKGRQLNHAFYLTKMGCQIQICKTFFMNTIDINNRVIQTVIKKRTSAGFVEEDKRGKHHSHHKLPECVKESIRNHINSIPRIESHYLRQQTAREFIEGGKTIADLHREYVEECGLNNRPHSNYVMYAKIFNTEFNLGFFEPKKDRCELCVAYEIAEDKQHLQQIYDQHLLEKQLSRQEKQCDKDNASETNIIAVYDLQAVLPVPKGDVSVFYYKSKLNCFNFTVSNLATKATECYFWHEGIGNRGSDEIGSCILQFIEKILSQINDGSAIDITFYSDNCGGQNKNKFIMALSKHYAQ
ncbi:unnamed protein product [Parnassius mnemosyne]|uniref:Uncharacterized protein n=1 Tax=Parnassius mnemosyne TaxID=213953 RepID=A0AAV1KFQ4_9NEOP